MIAELSTATGRRRMEEVRSCLYCGGAFHPYRPDQIACKAPCYRRWKNAQRPKVGQQHGTCEICGSGFPKAKYNQVTCSDECRAKHRAQQQIARKEGAPVKRHISDAELDRRALADLDRLRSSDSYRPHRSAITDMGWA